MHNHFGLPNQATPGVCTTHLMGPFVTSIAWAFPINNTNRNNNNNDS